MRGRCRPRWNRGPPWRSFTSAVGGNEILSVPLRTADGGAGGLAAAARARCRARTRHDADPPELRPASRTAGRGRRRPGVAVTGQGAPQGLPRGRGGRFITLEGGEGTGKSTQARRLVERIRALGREAIATREPGGSPRAELIREALLSGTVKPLGPVAEAMMFAAARIDHLDTTIRPALARGAVVVCDRFIDSTRVYQGALEGVDPALLAALERHRRRGDPAGPHHRARSRRRDGPRAAPATGGAPRPRTGSNRRPTASTRGSGAPSWTTPRANANAASWSTPRARPRTSPKRCG